MGREYRKKVPKKLGKVYGIILVTDVVNVTRQLQPL